MGVDAAVFAKKSKQYFYFDRQYNLLYSAKEPGDALNTMVYDWSVRLKEEGVSRDELLKLAEITKAYWERNGAGDVHRAGWCGSIYEFARRLPEDEVFFVVSDHDGPDFNEIARTDGYKEIRENDLFPPPPLTRYQKRRLVWKRSRSKRKNRKQRQRLKRNIRDLVRALDAGYRGCPSVIACESLDRIMATMTFRDRRLVLARRPLEGDEYK